MMSSRYPILDNRPIDQWKVTELKEELKKRKLATKGLKDDLIKRLDEAIRIEKDATEKDEANGHDPDPHPVVGVEDSEAVTAAAETVNKIERESPLTVETAVKGDTGVVEPIEGDNGGKIPEVLVDDSNKNDKLDGFTAPIDIDNSVPALGEVLHKGCPAGIDSARAGEEIAHGSIRETSIMVTESVITEVVVSGQDSHSTGTQKENGNSAIIKRENEEPKAWLEDEDSKAQLDQDIDLSCEDAVPHSSAQVNQVSEVNPYLGSQVKSNSVSSDSVSINEKIELKDNILADNVKLEQDIVRPEMVEPSSSNYVPVFDESHSMNGELHEKKSSVQQNRNDVTSPDLNKTNSSEDGGYPEKLNLDRSSGYDSMEEDLPESRQFNSKFNADESKEKTESFEVPIVKDDSITKVLGDGLSARSSDTLGDTDIHTAEKIKFHDQTSVGNNEPAKRQRRWNSETVKVTDPQSSNLPPAATHEDVPLALKHNFSGSDSSATDGAPKECIVPPPQRSPTNSLKIDRFLRPFTLKAVQELLGKTGNVTCFWMDHIKTHCYVTYSSVREAIETRNALYNLQWPPNGGRLLVAEFVDPQEVKMKLEPPVQAAPLSSGPAVPPTPPMSQPEPSPRQKRELPPVPATLPPPPPLLKAPPKSRERLPLPPPLPEKVDLPIVTLDDLFRKTSATPRIYYLPLSEEQVAAKLAAHGKSSKQ